MTETLRLGQAARLAGVCTKTILRWVEAGRLLPAEVTAAGEKRYSLAEVVAASRLKNRRAKRGAA